MSVFNVLGFLVSQFFRFFTELNIPGTSYSFLEASISVIIFTFALNLIRKVSGRDGLPDSFDYNGHHIEIDFRRNRR